MKILTTLRFSACLLTFTTVATSPRASAQTGSCDSIAGDVAAAVQKDPGKVLMIVEDALVINETCACEIIKAAIGASKADSALVNQIVQTGISVAPKMSGVIMDCATAMSPGAISSQVTATSGKDVKNPLPVVAPVVEDDFNPVPSSIRGVYLMQPPAGGFLPCDPNSRKCINDGISPTNTHPYYP